MSDLQALVTKLAAARGTPQRWCERECALLHFIAEIHSTTRVFCQGEVHLAEKGHAPSVLTYSTITKQVIAWAPTGRKDAMEGHHVAFFHGNAPYVGIAREVLMGPETVAIVDTHPQGQDPAEGLGS